MENSFGWYGAAPFAPARKLAGFGECREISGAPGSSQAEMPTSGVLRTICTAVDRKDPESRHEPDGPANPSISLAAPGLKCPLAQNEPKSGVAGAVRGRFSLPGTGEPL